MESYGGSGDPSEKLRLLRGCSYGQLPWTKSTTQWEGAVIVNDNCSRFKESQLYFSPMEAEAIALDFSISCCSYRIDYCPQVELYSDCYGLLDMLHKSLCDIENKRLQKIVAKAQNFHFNPNHIA